MGRVSPINVAQLLQPVAGENPAGVDLRLDSSSTSDYQSLLSALGRARKEERTALMMGSLKPDSVPAWTEVFDLSLRVLTTSKDLHVAVFLTEASLRKFGLAGLKDGFAVIRGLIETFWDQLHPGADAEGSFEKRLSFLRGIDGGERAGTLIAPIQLVPLINVNGQPGITLQLYGEEPEGDAVKAALSAIKPEQATELATLAIACREEFTALRDLMSTRCGDNAPPTRNIEEAIQQIVSAASSIEQKVSPKTEGEHVPDLNSAEDSGGSGAGTGATASGPIKSRAQALAMLDSVANFFQRHDPHSFVGYGAAEVARWGRMPLPELLGEMLQGNDSAREALSRRLGVIVKESQKPGT